MDLSELTRTSGEWLRGTGPESDIVISSRIRLARNLADFPFASRASSQEKTEIAVALRAGIKETARTRRKPAVSEKRGLPGNPDGGSVYTAATL